MDRMAELPDHDFFEPTLSEDDDAKDFDRPWRPMSLVFASFSAGPLGGGALFGINFKRLGRPQYMWPCITGGVVLGVLLSGFASWLVVSGSVEEGDRTKSQLIKHGTRALTVAIGLWLASRQKGRFRLFESTGGEAAPALVPGLLAVLLSALVGVALLWGFLALWAILEL